MIDFYQLDPKHVAEPLPSHLQSSCWRPERDGPPGPGSRRVANHFWWVLSKVGGFSRSGFAELRVERDGRVVHRLIVTPRWYRFPFMGPRDLQVGDVWTAPAARRQQLARAALGEVQRRFARDGATIWYVTEADNVASAALARACGYRHVATGRRTRRLGTALLGQYLIDRFV
jgi:RimJ/RimL family protein N-acetyltransferase